MSTLKAIGYMNAALTVMIEMSIQMQKLNAVLMAAQAEGRPISAEEWDQLDADLEAAKQRALEARPGE